MRARLLLPLLLAPAVVPFEAWSAATPRPGPFSAPAIAEDISLMPESDRQLRRLVIGLDANVTKYFMLPETSVLPVSDADPRVRHLRRQLYWLNFELNHGRIMSSVPPHTRFFVAVPEPGSVPGSARNEEEVFRDYLVRRIGWSPRQVAERIRFFRIPGTMPYPQDMAEPLGHDAKGRLVLGLGSETNEFYFTPLRRLVSSYPDEFVLREIPGVDTEGGDIELAWFPDGRLGVFVGRNRVVSTLESRHGRPYRGRRISNDEIRAMSADFSRAFFGLEVLLVGEPLLRAPELASEVLIHFDMVVSLLRGKHGMSAFIPTYRAAAVEANDHRAVESTLRRKAQAEYDAVARQLLGRGYRVIRLPFSDHPVRNPVQVGKFLDPATGQQTILLGKYPYHRDLPDGRNLQWQVQKAFDDLEDRVGAWRSAPSGANWALVEASLRAVWREMDGAIQGPNPEFDAQVRIYEENGVRVRPVPIYPSGEGGIHCLLLK